MCRKPCYKHRLYWNLELNPFHGIVRRYAFSLTASRIPPFTNGSFGVVEAKECYRNGLFSAS